MTEPEALRGEDLWPFDGDYPIWDPEDPWLVIPARQVAVREPWYRSPRLLLAMIGLAAATLVVAAALLITGRTSGELPARSLLDSRTSPAPPAPSESRAPSTPTEVGTPSASAPPSEIDPVEPAPPEEQPPAVRPFPSASAPPSLPIDPEGPAVSLTRNPMSFSPGGKGS